MLRRLFFLQGDEPRRLAPFFLIYFLLFAALTLADGISLTLFVQRVGAAALPGYYAWIAAANLALIGAYVLVVDRISSSRLFAWIAGLSAMAFLVTWLGVSFLGGGDGWFGFVFVTREVSYTLFLMHFGTFLQEYFSREQLVRVMPVVYAGGRVGGIAGSFMLEHLAPVTGVVALLLVSAALGMAAGLLGIALSAKLAPEQSSLDEVGDPGVVGAPNATAGELEQQARGSLRGFLAFVRRSPLMYWNTVTAIVYVVCRWVLNFQYNSFFGEHFEDEVRMAAFLGRYTQVALLLALLLQLFLVGRIVSWIGIRGAQFSYAVLLFTSFTWNLAAMSFPAAVLSRFVETELRFGFRNPINQLVINKFAKATRIRVRAFSIGLIIPLSTLASAGLVAGLTGVGPLLGAVGLGLGVAYLFGIHRLNGSFAEASSGK